jgi:hypothetical protein
MLQAINQIYPFKFHVNWIIDRGHDGTRDIWPNGVNLQNQQYGYTADMQRTVEYIRRAGLTVKPSGRTSG